MERADEVPPAARVGPAERVRLRRQGPPELTGADLVLTYVANSLEFADLFNNMALYFPRFVRATLGCAG
ncbi:MAG: hypothetical protein JNL82_07410 [Myxococcales bacterium]|nr:hypothetical protein [Myxococcales bacterium]